MNRPLAQQGIVALEMAMILPLLLMMLYGLVLFSIMFSIKGTVAFASTEGARAALVFQPASDEATALSMRGNQARNACMQSGEWLTRIHTKAYQCAVTSTPCSYDTSFYCVQVIAQYDYLDFPIVPLIGLTPGLVLPLLQSQAESQINVFNLF